MRRLLLTAATWLTLFALSAMGARLNLRLQPPTALAAAQSQSQDLAAPVPAPPAAAGSPVQVLPPQLPLPPLPPAPRPAPGNALQIPSLPQPSAPARPQAALTDQTLSRDTTDYLHHHRLPFVQAQVLRNGTDEVSVVLSGQVATEFGKRDAEQKARDFLRHTSVRIENQVDVNPEVASRPVTPPGHQTREIPLPSAFRGCWRLARDQQLGPVQLLAGASGGCFYTPNSGQFCYRRSGDGMLQPTFSSFAISRDPNLRNQWSRLEVLSTDGRSNARMRFLLHHVDSDLGPFWMLSGSHEIDETHQFDCRVEADRMRCIDHEFGSMFGRPWCNATHQDEFVRVME